MPRSIAPASPRPSSGDTPPPVQPSALPDHDDHAPPPSARRSATTTHQRIGAAPRYLLSHRGVLYFRARVPDELQACLGRREIRRSLGTSSLREARPKATSLASALFHIYDLARDTLMARRRTSMATRSTPPAKPASASTATTGAPLSTLTDSHLRQIMEEWLTEALQSTYERRLTRRQQIEDLEAERDQAGFHLSDAYEELETLNFTKGTKTTTAALLRHEGYEVSPEDERGAAFLKACHVQKIAEAAYLEQIASQHFTGNLVDSRWWPPAAGMTSTVTPSAQPTPTIAAASPAPVMAQPVTQSKADAITVAQAVDMFIAEKLQMKAWKSSAQNNIPQRLKIMVEILDGQSLPMSGFDRNLMKRLRVALARLPKNLRKYPHLKGKPMAEILALDLPKEERINITTASNYCGTIKSFINWAWKEDYLTTHPSKINDALFVVNPDGERVPDEFNAVAQTERVFSTDDLRRLFGSTEYLEDKHAKSWHHWLPLLGLYTGARIEELCQLYLDDIQAHDGGASGLDRIWVLNIHEDKERGQKVKTRAGNRLVPLHPFLVDDLGFLRHVEALKAAGETRLFPDLELRPKTGKYSDAASAWFTRYRRKCNVGGGENEHSGLRFHSFRHTLVTFCKEHKLAREAVKEVIGHTDAADQTDITVRYEGKLSPPALFVEVTQHINWHEELELTRMTGSKWRG